MHIYWIFDLFALWEDTMTSDPNKGNLLGCSSPNLMKRNVPFCIHCQQEHDNIKVNGRFGKIISMYQDRLTRKMNHRTFQTWAGFLPKLQQVDWILQLVAHGLHMAQDMCGGEGRNSVLKYHSHLCMNGRTQAMVSTERDKQTL